MDQSPRRRQSSPDRRRFLAATGVLALGTTRAAVSMMADPTEATASAGGISSLDDSVKELAVSYSLIGPEKVAARVPGVIANATNLVAGGGVAKSEAPDLSRLLAQVHAITGIAELESGLPTSAMNAALLTVGTATKIKDPELQGLGLQIVADAHRHSGRLHDAKVAAEQARYRARFFPAGVGAELSRALTLGMFGDVVETFSSISAARQMHDCLDGEQQAGHPAFPLDAFSRVDLEATGGVALATALFYARDTGSQLYAEAWRWLDDASASLAGFEGEAGGWETYILLGRSLTKLGQNMHAEAADLAKAAVEHESSRRPFWLLRALQQFNDRARGDFHLGPFTSLIAETQEEWAAAAAV